MCRGGNPLQAGLSLLSWDPYEISMIPPWEPPTWDLSDSPSEASLLLLAGESSLLLGVHWTQWAYPHNLE